jgi:hypothetical protein
MKVNGPAIYASRAHPPYRDGKLRFTALPDGTVNAIYLLNEGEPPPARVRLAVLSPARGAALRILGVAGNPGWRQTSGGIDIDIPAAARRSLAHAYAFTLQITAVRQ